MSEVRSTETKSSGVGWERADDPTHFLVTKEITMYRIHFDSKTSKWVIQMLWHGMLWQTCLQDGKPVTFEFYEGARSWAHQIGLNQAYHERAPEKDRFTAQLVGRAY